MADELRIGLKELLRKAQIEGDAEFLNEVWKHLKCVELKNLCCESLAELKIELRTAKERRPYMSSDAGHSGDASLFRGESAKLTLVVSTR